MNAAMLRSDPDEIQRAFALLSQGCFELRAPKAGSAGTISGYFTDSAKATLAAQQIDGKAPGIYVTLNPVKPSLLARSENRTKSRAEQATSDADIERRVRLLFDIDAQRPAGISSNEVEHQAALEMARQARDVLRVHGWPEPIFADSGNGAHLVYAIDLPNDAAATELTKRVLTAAASKFDRDGIQVDQTVFNAARITKLYGTIARKGDSTLERPHRLARIIESPGTLVPVSRELLEAFAGTIPGPEPRRESGEFSQGSTGFDIDAWLSRYGLTSKRGPVPHQGGRKWILDACPFNPDHKAPDAAVFQGADGRLGFKCLHASCMGRDWHTLRAHFEPTRVNRSSAPAVASAVACKSLKTATALDVYNSEFTEPEPIIEGLLYAGLTVFTARPKTGKSWFAMQIALAVANDTWLAGRFRVRKPGRVLYIALEENQRRTAPRLRKLTGPTDFLEDISFVYEIDSLMGGGAAQIDKYLTETECRLVVIDTYFAFARQADRKSVDILQNDYNSVNILRELAQKHNCAILLVHHSRKAGGESVDTVLGTTGFTAACDAIWNLKRQGEGDSVLTVTGREMEEAIYGMRLEQGEPFGWKVMSQGADVELSKQRREITDLLREEGSQTPKGIADLLKKNAVTVRRHLQRLVQDGFVLKVDDAYSLVERMNA